MKKASKALVIVDMQEDFCTPMTDGQYLDWDADRPRITNKLIHVWWERHDGIIEAIRHAKEHNWHIIVLEYANYGSTLSTIQEEIGDYKHTTYRKRRDNGADKILPYIRRYKIKKVYMVGCNSESCVYDTWVGLTYNREVRTKKLELSTRVYLPGTLTFNHGYGNNAFSYMKKLYTHNTAIEQLRA